MGVIVNISKGEQIAKDNKEMGCNGLNKPFQPSMKNFKFLPLLVPEIINTLSMIPIAPISTTQSES